MSKLLTTADLKGRTFGTFHRNGVSVDLVRYFKTDAGKRALAEISSREAETASTPKGNKKAG
jgi:hypothetical protein